MKHGILIRSLDGVQVLVLSARSATDKDKWLSRFAKEREVVQQDKDAGTYAYVRGKSVALPCQCFTSAVCCRFCGDRVVQSVGPVVYSADEAQ